MCCGHSKRYVVTYPPDDEHPDGRTEIKTSLISAQIAAGKVRGATYAEAPRQPGRR